MGFRGNRERKRIGREKGKKGNGAERENEDLGGVNRWPTRAF